VPAAQPPVPPLTFDGTLQQALEAAVLAVGRLDGVSSLLPDRSLFLYSYVRKEAVLSSQIEGTQSSLSDLLLFELDEALRRRTRSRTHAPSRRVPALESAHPRNPRRAPLARARQREGPG